MKIVASVVGLVLVVAMTLFVLGMPVFESGRLLVEGALLDKVGLARTFVKFTPLLLCSLGVIVAWRSSMINIGGEGQFVMGGIASALVFKLIPNLSHWLLTPLLLMASIFGGGVYGWLAGWMQQKRGVPVVISTIFLNFIALNVLEYVVNGPLQETRRQLPQSERLPNSVMLTKFSVEHDFHTGVFIAVLAALIVYVWLYLMKSGFLVRVVGENQRFAQVAKVPVSRVQLGAIAISGSLCGLAGGIEYTSLAGTLSTSFSQNWGFLALPTALLGGLHPIGAAASSLFFGALIAGTDNLARFGKGDGSIVFVVQAVSVLAFLAIQRISKRGAKT